MNQFHNVELIQKYEHLIIFISDDCEVEEAIAISIVSYK